MSGQNMSFLGTYIRDRREARHLLLRQVAHALDMDATMLSKVERGVRTLKEDKLPLLAELLDLDLKTLRTRWIADKVCLLIENEENPRDVLKVAESQLLYHTNHRK